MTYSKRTYLILECALLFFCLPFAFYSARHHLAYRIIPLVCCLALGCYFYLKSKRRDSPEVVLEKAELGRHLKAMLLLFILSAPFLLLITYIAFPDLFLAFPQKRPYRWALVFVLYPLSTYPQEIIFRGFFFQRYESLFAHPLGLIIVNGLSFGLMHMVYGNWIAPILCTIGGLLFAYRYQKTQSLFLVSLEHGLWGTFLYTIGLGWFFYSGSIV